MKKIKAGAKKSLSLLIIIGLLLAYLPDGPTFGKDTAVAGDPIPLALSQQEIKDPAAAPAKAPAKEGRPEETATASDKKAGTKDRSALLRLQKALKEEADRTFDGDGNAYFSGLSLKAKSPKGPTGKVKVIQGDKGYFALDLKGLQLEKTDRIHLQLDPSIELVTSYYGQDKQAELTALLDRLDSDILSDSSEAQEDVDKAKAIKPDYALEEEGLALDKEAAEEGKDGLKSYVLSPEKADLESARLLFYAKAPVENPPVNLQIDQAGKTYALSLEDASSADKNGSQAADPAQDPADPAMSAEAERPAKEINPEKDLSDLITPAEGENSVLLRSSHEDDDRRRLVKKVWGDGNENHDGKSVTVNVYFSCYVKYKYYDRYGEKEEKKETLKDVPYTSIELTSNQNWQGAFDELGTRNAEYYVKKYLETKGYHIKEIKEVEKLSYSLKEVPVAGYEGKVSWDKYTETFTITNTKTEPQPEPGPEPGPGPGPNPGAQGTQLVKKVWGDGNENHDGKSVTVNVYFSCYVKYKYYDRYGEKEEKKETLKDVPYTSIELTSNQNWQGAFDELGTRNAEYYVKKYLETKGYHIKEIKEVEKLSYSLKEVPVAGYEGKVSWDKYTETFTITNTKTEPQPEPGPEPGPGPGPGPGPNPGAQGTQVTEIKKMIDYLGDEAGNPDTGLAGKEDYRQYLAFTGQEPEPTEQPGYDFLIAVDTTYSMTEEDYKDFDGNYKRRDVIANQLLNGGTGGDGLLTQLLKANPKNQACVMTFVGHGKGSYGGPEDGKSYDLDTQTKVLYEWQSLEGKDKADEVSVLYTDGTGTNYCTPLYRAAQLFNDRRVKDDNKKVLIFITDGEPHESVSTYDDGDNTVTISKNRDARARHNREAYNYLKEQVGALDFHSIAIKIDRDNLGYLEKLTEAAGGKLHLADDAEGLTKAFDNITSSYYTNNLYLKDLLSPYVNLNKDQVDFKIKRFVNGEKEGTVIWEGGVGKYHDAGDYNYTPLGHAVNDGDKYIKWASYSSGVGERKQDRVQVQFQKGYNLGNETFQVSYNLKINDTAKEYLAKHPEGYPHTGEPNTDFGENKTSSGKHGFYSNQEAQLTYMQAGEKRLEKFPHPVVQTTNPGLKIKKVDWEKTSQGLKGASFALYREDPADSSATAIAAYSGTGSEKTTSFSTDGQGDLFIRGLEAGDYYLKEVEAPAGYRQLDRTLSFNLDEKGNVTIEGTPAPAFSLANGGIQVKNIKEGRELPEAGGPGRGSWAGLAILLVLAGAIRWRFCDGKIG